MLPLLAIALLAQTPQHRLFMQPNLPRQSGVERFAPPPPFPTPPSARFYAAPSGGFGIGSGPCRGQPVVDVSQNAITYGRSSGVAGDGGVAVATCVRESDGLGVELSGGEPSVMQSPTYSSTFGLMNESAGANFLSSTWALDSAPWIPTAAVTANTWTGPFSFYRTESGFEQLNDSSAVASQGVCQTVATTTQTTYAFSCTLRSGTATAAQLTITGTGSAAGNRTCTVTGLDSTLSRDDRKGCVTAAAFGAGLTAVTACVLVGSSAAATGTIGAVDCQLEKNDHVTSYMPNGWLAGTTTRLIASATIPTLPATLTLSDTAGCAASDLYTFRYDAEAFWSIVTTTNGTARGPYYFPDTTARALDGTNTATVARSSLFNATASAKAMWAADGGFSINVYDAGIGTVAYDGTMFGTVIAPSTIGLENNTGSQDGIVSNIILDDADYKCGIATMANITRIGWMGDSLSARIDPDAVNPPAGFFLRESVNGTNFSVVGAEFNSGGNPCTGQWALGGNGTYDTAFMWCGVNDILTGALGASLFATELAWVRTWAYRGIQVYWIDIAPFAGYDSAPGKLAERNAFNALYAAYCSAPETNVHCAPLASTLAEPGNTNYLNPPYSYDGLHLTQAGATAASVATAGQYP